MRVEIFPMPRHAVAIVEQDGETLLVSDPAAPPSALRFAVDQLLPIEKQATAIALLSAFGLLPSN